MKKKFDELEKVIVYLRDKVGLKLHKATHNAKNKIEFFRGVNFHCAVLQHGAEILSMIPIIREECWIDSLSTIEDSIRLGQAMIDSKNLLVVKADSHFKSTEKEKIPRFVMTDFTAEMKEGGLYSILV